jgi:hypothetical protein
VWWNAECENARKKFNKARKMSENSVNNNNLRKTLSKSYKKKLIRLSGKIIKTYIVNYVT